MSDEPRPEGLPRPRVVDEAAFAEFREALAENRRRDCGEAAGRPSDSAEMVRRMRDGLEATGPAAFELFVSGPGSFDPADDATVGRFLAAGRDRLTPAVRSWRPVVLGHAGPGGPILLAVAVARAAAVIGATGLGLAIERVEVPEEASGPPGTTS